MRDLDRAGEVKSNKRQSTDSLIKRQSTESLIKRQSTESLLTKTLLLDDGELDETIQEGLVLL